MSVCNERTDRCYAEQKETGSRFFYCFRFLLTADAGDPFISCQL